MNKIPPSIEKKLKQRKNDLSLRKLLPINNLIDFSSNDYLGFSKSKKLYNQAHQLLIDTDNISNGSTGSRLLSGNHPLFAETEREIAKFHQAESALIYNSGYDANLGLLSCIPQRGDILFYDEYIHASLRDGIRLSNAKAYKYKHNDLEDLETKIQNIGNKSASIYIITESIFSMDGDAPDLKKLVQIAKIHKAFLIIDEAHATGVIGKNGVGLVQDLKLENEIFARVHTFGKGIGSHGAVILGSKKLKEYLINFSRSFIYSTALPPVAVAYILMAYQELKETKQIEKLHQNIQFFKTEINKKEVLKSAFIESDASIQCCLIPGNEQVKFISKTIKRRWFRCKSNPTPYGS